MGLWIQGFRDLEIFGTHFWDQFLGIQGYIYKYGYRDLWNQGYRDIEIQGFRDDIVLFRCYTQSGILQTDLGMAMFFLDATVDNNSQQQQSTTTVDNNSRQQRLTTTVNNNSQQQQSTTTVDNNY